MPFLAATDGVHVIVGSYDDFSTPGEISVFEADGALVATLQLGIGPGAIAAY